MTGAFESLGFVIGNRIPVPPNMPVKKQIARTIGSLVASFVRQTVEGTMWFV